jgi:hypothetical protein
VLQLSLMAHLTENDPPQSFADEPDAKLTPFFKSIAKYIDDEEMSKKIVAAKDIVKQRYARPRVGMLFGLEWNQFGNALAEAGGHREWVGTFEDFANRKFKRCDDVGEVGHVSADGRAKEQREPEGLQVNSKENTIEQQLGDRMLAKLCVPKACVYAARIAVPNDATHIAPHERKAIVYALVVWIFAKWGRFNAGMKFVRESARVLSKVYPKAEIDWVRCIGTTLHGLERKDAAVRSLHAPVLHACYMRRPSLSGHVDRVSIPSRAPRVAVARVSTGMSRASGRPRRSSDQ